MKVINFILEML